MAHWFEDLTRTMADERIGRRMAIRRVAGTVVAVAIASALPVNAEAKRKRECPIGGDCSLDGPSCNGNPNPNCYCFIGIDGRGVCGCNSLCSQSPACKSSADCAKGYTCITANGCTGCNYSSAVCVPKCRDRYKNCQLPDGHGLTATGRVV